MALATAIASCSVASEPKPIPPFRQADARGNAVKLADFVRQQCLERATDLDAFQAGLKATGWPARRTQTATPDKPLELDVWELPALTVLRGQLVPGGVWTCAVALAKPMAPTIQVVRSALTHVAATAPDVNGEWWWNDGNYRFHMTIEASQKGGVFINVEDYRLPWWRSILG